MKCIVSIICFIVLSSCSTGVTSISTQASEYPLSNEKAYSKTSNIYIDLPYGWFVAEDNECNCTDLWIVKDDYSGSISFRKINLDEETLHDLSGNETEKIAAYSKIFVRTILGKNFDKFSGEETFKLGEKTFSAFRYVNEKNQRIRAVIFKHFDDFFESDAISSGYSEFNELIKIQNAVLSTLN